MTGQRPAALAVGGKLLACLGLLLFGRFGGVHAAKTAWEHQNPKITIENSWAFVVLHPEEIGELERHLEERLTPNHTFVTERRVFGTLRLQRLTEGKPLEADWATEACRDLGWPQCDAALLESAEIQVFGEAR